MSQSLLFSQNAMPPYFLSVSAREFSPSVPSPLPQDPPFYSSGGNRFNQQTRRQIQKTMSYTNNFENHPDLDVEGDAEYTITHFSEERLPDPYVPLWPHPYTTPGSLDNWSTPRNVGHPNELTPSVSGYCQSALGNNTLSLYNIPGGSPAMSDSTLSPYLSSALSTPSSPDGSYRPFSHSPASSTELRLTNVDNQSQGRTQADTDKKYTHREQLVMFREALSLPMDGAGPFVPQHMYKPHTTSDRKRYVEEVPLEYPLYFYSDAMRCGISLKDALHSRTKKLANREQVVFEGRGPSVSIRLEWPGYRQWSRQIPTKDFRNPPGPITLAKLAKNVAKCVQRFIQERKDTPMEEDTDHRWRIGDGPNDIKLEDLVLVSMHHVSLGSWQPQLRLVRQRELRFNRPAIPTLQAVPPPSATVNGIPVPPVPSSIALSYPRLSH